jgi:hypothetical protein
MKSDKLKSEIYSLEAAVLKVVEQCKKVASMADFEPDLLEELQQIAIALHYTMQTLRTKAELPNVSVTSNAPPEFSPDLRMTTKLPLKSVGNKTKSR